MKRQIWTTYCPSKICWELTKIDSRGKSATSNWLQNKKIINESLILLKKYGITGIRLVIFPSELTEDGKKIDWKPIEAMLELCTKNKILVDLCIGPFQYPHYPGIYLPGLMLPLVREINSIDTNPELWSYGVRFLELQMKKYKEDKRIHGFHFANEWPDAQHVSGREKIRTTVSQKFMLEGAKLLKNTTDKPISLNTNIDPSSKNKLENVFGKILNVFGSQGKLGFDIYPSQETWRKKPLLKLRRIWRSYVKSIFDIKKRFDSCEIYFAEIEAQPWGNGKSWYELIKKETNPHTKVLSYSNRSLINTWKNHIKSTTCTIISLWGSDFWLSAERMGINWPLKQIQILKSQK